MVDHQIERPLSLGAAAASLPGTPHVSTLHRWRMRGVHGSKLETCILCGRRPPYREALNRFITRTTAAADRPSDGLRQPRSSGRDDRAAEAELLREEL